MRLNASPICRALLVISALLFSPKARAFDWTAPPSEKIEVNLRDDVVTERFRLLVTPEYTMMSNNGVSLSGFGAQGAFSATLNKNWTIGLGFRQSFSGGLAALFTEIDVRSSYALSGSFLSRSRRVYLNGDEVYTSQDVSNGGMRLDFYVSQYFFNLLSSVLPLSGIGAGLHYEIPSSTGTNYLVGFRMDYVTSGEISIMPMQFYAGIIFWL